MLPSVARSARDAMARRTSIPDRNWVNVQWLARVRWAQTAGQASTVLVAQFVLDGALPITSLFLVIAVGLLSNLGLELYFFGDRRRDGAPARTVHEWQLAVLMMFDVAVLTGLLYLAGGPHNPFGLLYVVQIALATVLLRAKWAWILSVVCSVGFGILLVAHEPLAIPEDNRAIGAWVALGVASAFVLHFLLRITAALALRDRELAQARGLAARQERLASLATMAAGAAHELSTPLGTVALAAKELERALLRAGDSEGGARGAPAWPELAADARLIREQVGRCRVILDQMAQGAGTVGESVATCTVAQLLDDALEGARPAAPVHRDLPPELGARLARVPRRAVSQALRSLITNAQDASPEGAAVVIAVREASTSTAMQPRLAIAIRDRGAGMTSDVLARIGEPFYTTKPPGRGMGLGLFLARAVIEGVGGALEILSRASDGTEVRVELPLDVMARAAPAPPSRRSGPGRRDAPSEAPVDGAPAAQPRTPSTR
jgi:two-component system sensor histidine kinase RegB